MRDRRYLMGLGLVLLAGVFWSLAGILLRNTETATSWQIVFYRSASFVVVVLAVLAARHRSRLPRALAAIGWAGVVGALCLAAGSVAIVLAMLNTTIANVLFIYAATPFFIALLGRLILKELVPGRTWAAIAVALAGVAALLGDSLAISLHDLVICVVLGAGQIGCGMIAFAIGSRHVAAALLGLGSMTEVALGPIWVWLGVGEVPSWLTLGGGAVVLSAVVTQAVWALRGEVPAVAAAAPG